jgi:hypothetical protein
MLTIENLHKIVGKHDYEYEIMSAEASTNGKLYGFGVLDIGNTGPARTLTIYLERKADSNGWYKLAGPPMKRNNQVSLTIESIEDMDRLFNYIKMLC